MRNKNNRKKDVLNDGITIEDPEYLILNFLNSYNFTIINKSLLKIFEGDCDSVVVLTEILNYYKYCLNNGGFEKEENYFKMPFKRLEYILGMSYNKLRRILKKLKQINVISLIQKNFPRESYIKIEFDEIFQLLKNLKDKDNIKTISFYKKLNKELNEVLFTIFSTKKDKNDKQFLINRFNNLPFNNTGIVLKNSIIIISYILYNYCKIEWSPNLMAKLKTFLNKKFVKKSMDYGIFYRGFIKYTNNLQNLKDISLQNYLDFIKNNSQIINEVFYKKQILSLDQFFENYDDFYNFETG